MNRYSPSQLNKGYCFCGCGEKTEIAKKTRSKIGHKKGEYLKFINHHHVRINKPDYIINKKTNCWEWDGYVDANGYPGFLSNGGNKKLRAYVFYYIKHKGGYTPGMVLDHICSNRACVNPDHLDPVTQKENIKRTWKRGRGRWS